MDGPDRIAPRSALKTSNKARRRRASVKDHVDAQSPATPAGEPDALIDPEAGELFGPDHLFGTDDPPDLPAPLSAEEGIEAEDT